MLKRDLVDELYGIALRRYKKECPNYEFTNEFAERLWFSIKGILDHEGEIAARDYVENALLFKPKKCMRDIQGKRWLFDEVNRKYIPE